MTYLRIMLATDRNSAVNAHAASETRGSRYRTPVASAETKAATSTANPPHPQHLGSHPTSGSLHLSLLLKRAQHTVKQLWSSGASNLPSGEHGHGAVHQSSQLPHSSEEGDSITSHQEPHSTLISSNVTNNKTSAPNHSDLLAVMREAEELGFEAAVFSSHLSPGQAQADTAARGATPSLSHSPSPAASGTENDDHLGLNQSAMLGEAQSTTPSLGVSLHNLGQAGNKSSSSRLHMPEEGDEQDATSFAIDALGADAATEKAVKAASAGSQDEQTDAQVCTL